MMEKYKNLSAAISIFTEELDLSKEQTIGILDSDIKQGYIELDGLKKELTEALNDSNFNWVEFAVSNRLIIYNVEKYDNESVKKLVKSLMCDYLFES